MQLETLRQQPHVSVNQLKTFLACPRKYRLQYIERIEPAFRPVAMAFGSAFHEAFALRMTKLQSQEPLPNGQLHEHFAEAMRLELSSPGPPVLFEDDEDEPLLVRRGHAMIDALVRTFPRPDRVLAVEQPFRIELVDSGTGEVAELPLVGAIDAIVERGQRTVGIELKTGARRWAEDGLLFDLQITAYQRVLRTDWNDSAQIELVLVTKSDRPDVQLERLARTREDEDELVAVTSSVLRGVDAGVDHPVRGWRCKTCPYMSACR